MENSFGPPMNLNGLGYHQEIVILKLKTKNSYFLEFYNDSNDNFFRISDSDGNIIGFIDGNELRKIQLEERFCNFIFDDGSFMFSVYSPI